MALNGLIAINSTPSPATKWVASPQFDLPALTKHRSLSLARKPRRKSRSVPDVVAHTSTTTTSSAASWPVKGSSAVPGCASVANVELAQAPSQVASTKAPSGTVPKNEACVTPPRASGAPTLAVSSTFKLEPFTRLRSQVPLTDSRPTLLTPADRHMTVAVADATGVVGMLVLGCGVEGLDVGAAVGVFKGAGEGWVVICSQNVRRIF